MVSLTSTIEKFKKKKKMYILNCMHVTDVCPSVWRLLSLSVKLHLNALCCSVCFFCQYLKHMWSLSLQLVFLSLYPITSWSIHLLAVCTLLFEALIQQNCFKKPVFKFANMVLVPNGKKFEYWLFNCTSSFCYFQFIDRLPIILTKHKQAFVYHE